MAILQLRGVDITSGQLKPATSSDSTYIPGWLRVGTATAATAQGDIVAGSTADYLFYDGALAKLSIYDDSGLGSSSFVSFKTGQPNYVALWSYNSDVYWAPTLSTVRARGTRSSPAVVQNGDTICSHYVRAYSDASTVVICGGAHWSMDGTPSVSSMPTRYVINTTPSGSTTSRSVFAVWNSGGIGVGACGSHTASSDYGDIVAGDGTNGELFWDSSNGTLLLDEGAATVAFRAVRSGKTCQLRLDAYSSNSFYENPQIFLRRGRGTEASYSSVIDGDEIGRLAWQGKTSGSTQGVFGTIWVRANGTPNSGSSPGYMCLSTTQVGATTSTERLRIMATGAITGGVPASSSAVDEGDFGVTDGTREMFWDANGGTGSVSRLNVDGEGQFIASNDGQLTSIFKNASTGAAAACLVRVRNDADYGLYIQTTGSNHATSPNWSLIGCNSTYLTVQSGVDKNLNLLTSGNGSGNTGNIRIDTGTASVTAGTISIADTNATALTLGRTALGVSIPGSLNVGDVAAPTTAEGNAKFEGNTDGIVDVAITNRSSGTAARSRLVLNADSGAIALEAHSSTYTSYSDMGTLVTHSTLANGLRIGANAATGPIVFHSGGTTKRWEITANGNLVAGSDGGYDVGSDDNGTTPLRPDVVYVKTDIEVDSIPITRILSRTTSVDLANASTDVALYTVPTGKSAVITSVIVRPTTATSANGDAQVSVGTNANRDDIIASQTLTALDATTEGFTLGAFGIFHIAAASEVIRFEVDSADTGTALVATVDLLGYLI